MRGIRTVFLHTAPTGWHVMRQCASTPLSRELNLACQCVRVLAGACWLPGDWRDWTQVQHTLDWTPFSTLRHPIQHCPAALQLHTGPMSCYGVGGRGLLFYKTISLKVLSMFQHVANASFLNGTAHTALLLQRTSRCHHP